MVIGKYTRKTFEKLKQDLSSDTVMAYYDSRKQIEVVTDASPVGLSGILTQEGKVVAYASRALSQQSLGTAKQREREGR